MAVIWIDSSRFAPAGGTWTPAQISTALWLDAADASTVTTVSGAVSEWRDKSGNSQHAVQATGTARPTYNATAFNGLPALSFSGSNKLLNSTMSLGVEYSFYGAGRLDLADSYKRLFSVNQDASAFIGAQDSSFMTIFGSYPVGTWNDISPNTPPVSVTTESILGVIKGNGPGLAIPYVNGVAQDAKNGNTQPVIEGYTIGGWPGGGQEWIGTISEIIISGILDSAADRQRIEGYLAHKWSLTANLPAGHPYKTTAP